MIETRADSLEEVETLSTHADLSSRPLSLVPLQCPQCRRPLEFAPADNQPLPGGRFGLVSCGAHTYPVLDDIPVIRHGQVSVQDHLTGRTEVIGPEVDELVAQIRDGQCLDALTTLLAFPPAIPFGLEEVPGLRLPFTRGPGHRGGMALRRRRVQDMLTRGLDALTAQDWFDVSYLRSRNISDELYPYFLMRFGQPRYLASLSLVGALPAHPKPVLDLACGFAHIMYHLAQRADRLDSVGVDRNFFQLWVARRYVAPDASYVCADALEPFPFADDAFSATICTDSFHLFPEKSGAMAELRRCAQDGTVVIDRVGNALLEPREGDELTPRGYLDLVGTAPHRMVGETALIESYRNGRGPQLAEATPTDRLAEEKWLSLVISDSSAIFVDHGTFGRWPHGEGHLGINPIYRVEPDGDGVLLRFEFPSTWYAFENAGMLAYHSPGVRLDRHTFEQLRAGAPTARTKELLERFVVLAMPPRYARVPDGRSHR